MVGGPITINFFFMKYISQRLGGGGAFNFFLSSKLEYLEN